MHSSKSCCFIAKAILAVYLSSTIQVHSWSASRNVHNVRCKATTQRLYANTADIRDDGGSSNRRNFLVTASTAVAATATVSQYTNTNTNVSNDVPAAVVPQTLTEAVQWIDDNCDRRFIHAMVSSDYQFLYRGVDSNVISIPNEKPDLLTPGTYEDTAALAFFQNLETTILSKELVKPSNGHLATTSIKDASQWGSAASIWPLDGAHYAWFEDEKLFFPRPSASSSAAVNRNDIIVDGKDCGKNSLEDALRSDSCEVMMYTPSNSYLAVPASLDVQLRDALKDSFLI